MKLQIPAFDKAHVLVVGDVMLDRYWHGSTSRISPEAPVPVVHVRQNEERPGGAGNVALNIAALQAGSTVVGLTGDDEAADSLVRSLEAAGVQCRFQRLIGTPTITKLRVISRHQQLIRLDFEDGFEDFDTGALLDNYKAALAGCGAVVISDYGKGTLKPLRELIDAARAAGKPVLVDPKSTDFTPYTGASLITPNLNEFEAVVGQCRNEAELVAKGLELIRRHDLGALLITRGEHGMTLLRAGQPELHLPAQAREVFDVTGAGDTVIAVLAAALAAGEGMAEATALANIAAGIVVAKLGTATASVPEIRRALAGRHEAGYGVLSQEQLLVAVEEARAHGERIVMTNGCFDILHAGHVGYLSEARRLGDRLIIAVNDDDSVRRLKGEGRPINSVDRRMTVLAALESVDWVVPFSEDTPERIICSVKPDILVKGGDYQPEQIAGHQCVTAAGGEVKVLGFEDGVSTSRIIDALRQREEH
jgi:D-beta-D-heptose 7-phosphate kinase/D-beta-D-heptose 1-phosphate adenosyltransferase